MKHVLSLTFATLLLFACGPVSLYYKPGASVARLNTDQTNCEVSALRDAPVANQIRRNPPRFVPGRRICDAAGACFERPGYWVSGEIYTVDVNADLRGRVRDQCMAAKGYQPASIPRCSADVQRAAPPRATTRLPTLTAASCIIPNKDGSWQIVTPVQTKKPG